MKAAPQEIRAILIVDDESSNVDTLARVLENEGYRVFSAMSGLDGLAILDRERVDLVLLDVLMPGLDGFETLSRIRVHKRTKDLPVIFLTGIMREPEYMERGFILGVNEYLVKPIETNELLVRVRSILRMTAAEKAVKQLQADFFSMLVHDLRGPLTAVRSFAQVMMEEKKLGEQERSEMLRTIESASEHMLNLIGNILDLSKLESEYVTLNKKLIDLAATVGRSLMRMKPLAEQKAIVIEKEFDKDLSTVNADEQKIEQVMDNLLMNAIKFTGERGTITVSVRELSASGDVGGATHSIVVAVKDSGMGIPEKEIPFMFDKYRQIVTSQVSPVKGTGLGLAICKNIVEAHKGRIWVDSKEHRGSTFSFSLPRE